MLVICVVDNRELTGAEGSTRVSCTEDGVAIMIEETVDVTIEAILDEAELNSVGSLEIVVGGTNLGDVDKETI